MLTNELKITAVLKGRSFSTSDENCLQGTSLQEKSLQPRERFMVLSSSEAQIPAT